MRYNTPMGKEIGVMIGVVVGLPLLIRSLSWSVGYAISPSPENIEKGVELIADAAVPWWLGVMESLAALPLAGLLIFGFILFLRWAKVV